MKMKAFFSIKYAWVKDSPTLQKINSQEKKGILPTEESLCYVAIITPASNEYCQLSDELLVLPVNGSFTVAIINTVPIT